jgi:hypothetical protein
VINNCERFCLNVAWCLHRSQPSSRLR